MTTTLHPNRRPLLVAILAVAAIQGGLLIGREPAGGDPDRIFRPIKAELVRAFGQGRLPFWSDRFGLGVPLVAESHVAAFYPPNHGFYRVFDVSTAYRLSMWGHYLVLVVATFAYARRLGIEPWGSALSAVSFAFCGFLTIHASHEWAYQTLAYLPLCLLLADHFAESGRWRWLALLALAWGCQIFIGHFQVQMWTAGLVVVTGGWRIVADRRPTWRILGLILALAWGGLVASAQLVPTWELAQIVGQTRRPYGELAFYSYPPGHWPELAIPGLFRWLRGGPEAAYWFGQQTTGYEACLFVGTIPLILACVGLVGGRDRLAPWRLIIPASLALATMPRWWPTGYAAVLQLPGLGYFRCPARYTAIASLGLALMAGRGLDRALSGRQFGLGLALAVLLALGAFAMAWTVSSRPELKGHLGSGVLETALILAASTWVVGVGAVLLHRRGRVGSWLLFLLATVEVGALYHAGAVRWAWSIDLPGSSPVLAFLAREGPSIGRVEGPLDNIPVLAGVATANPYVGFPLPHPHPLLKGVTDPRVAADRSAGRWLRRFGVTHAVGGDGVVPEGEVLFRGEDPALDRLAGRATGVSGRPIWSVVRLPDPFPTARVATRSVEAPDRNALIASLSASDGMGEARSLPDARPPTVPGSRARSARVIRWGGSSGEVEHDGVCDLVLSRAYYPGWTARIDDGPDQPTWPADGGLLAVRIGGSGVSRVSIRYEPNGWAYAAVVSSVAVVGALVVVGFGLGRGRWKPIQASGSR